LIDYAYVNIVKRGWLKKQIVKIVLNLKRCRMIIYTDESNHRAFLILRCWLH